MKTPEEAAREFHSQMCSNTHIDLCGGPCPACVAALAALLRADREAVREECATLAANMACSTACGGPIEEAIRARGAEKGGA